MKGTGEPGMPDGTTPKPWLSIVDFVLGGEDDMVSEHFGSPTPNHGQIYTSSIQQIVDDRKVGTYRESETPT